MDTAKPPIFISSNYSRILARELHLQEKDLSRLLQGSGLSREVLLPGDETRLSGAQQLRIIQNARAISGAPELGLRMGRQLQPATHGPIGYLALSSPDLMTALLALRDFLPLRIAISQLELEMSERWLTCSLDIRVAAPADDKRMLAECFALSIQAVVESILGKPAEGARFEFEFSAPGYRQLYKEYFHLPTRFSCTRNQMLIPIELAYAANTANDPASYRLAQEMCQTLLDEVPANSLSMSNRVKRLLLSMPPGTASEESIARALFVTKRTLARRLQREGTGYRKIRETLFAELAARHLRESDLSVEAIAALLGYHDSANFRRACRRWYGISPQELRQSQSLDAGFAAGA
jgi:AraC-like DNA-binding protein